MGLTSPVDNVITILRVLTKLLGKTLPCIHFRSVHMHEEYPLMVVFLKGLAKSVGGACSFDVARFVGGYSSRSMHHAVVMRHSHHPKG